MPSVEERLATIEQVLRDVRDDVAAAVSERHGITRRLHDVEGAMNEITTADRLGRRATETRQRRIELRLQVLAVMIGLACVAAPLVAALLASH